MILGYSSDISDPYHGLVGICEAVVTIGAALFAFQQFAGINAIFYFSSTVFRKAGMTSDVAASVLVGVVNLLGTFANLLCFVVWNVITL